MTSNHKIAIDSFYERLCQGKLKPSIQSSQHFQSRQTKKVLVNYNGRIEISFVYPMRVNIKERMDNDQITDEHVVREDRSPLSTKKRLTGKKLKEAKKKERKIRNAASKRNADNKKSESLHSNEICEPADTLQQVSSSDTSIENAIEENFQSFKGFAVGNNTNELFTKNITAGAKIRESDKKQSTISSNNYVKKSLQSCSKDENRGEISTTQQFKPDEQDIAVQKSTQSYYRHEKAVCSTKKPLVDYNFPNNEQYERHLRDCSSPAQNLERKRHNKSPISSEKNDFEVKSAQAAGGCASKKEDAYETLSMLDKLFKCIFEVAKPVLQERLSNLLSVENRTEFGKFLINNIEYFYHQKKNHVELTCKCITTGRTSCKTLIKVKNNKKQGNLNETVFFNLYGRRNTKKCTNQDDKECLCVYESNKDNITNLDFNDLQFLILECDRNITNDQKRSLMTLVKSIRNDVVCHRNKTLTDEKEKGLWEVLKESILSLCNPLTSTSFAMHIHVIDGLKTVTNVELEALQKQYETLKLEHNAELERQDGINKEQEKTNKDNTTKIGELREQIDQLGVAFSFMKKNEYAQETKSSIEVKVESSNTFNEEKAVNDLNQDDGSDDHGLHIESIKRNCLLLELKASPSIFKNETTLKHAIMSLVKRIAKAGDIDTSVPSTINVKVVFNKLLKNDEEDVIRRMLSLSVQGKNHEKVLHEFQKEASISDNEDDTDASLYKNESILNEDLDLTKKKRFFSISASSSDNEDKDNTNTSSYQDLKFTAPRYNCRNCFKKDEIIIQLDRRLCKIRQRAVQEKQFLITDLKEKHLVEDLMKLTSLTSVDEKKDIKEKELKINLKSRIISDFDVLTSRTTEVLSTESDPLHDGSDLRNRISELTLEYATDVYEKKEGQSGLAIILYNNRGSFRMISHVKDNTVSESEDFFKEMGFMVKCIEYRNYVQLLSDILYEDFYCVFVVFLECVGYQDHGVIENLCRSRNQGIPIIVITNCCHYDLRQIAEEPDSMIVSLQNKFRGWYRLHEEVNIFDDFIKVTRSNRFADIMDILTRVNAFYDRPAITIQSTLKKKFCFL